MKNAEDYDGIQALEITFATVAEVNEFFYGLGNVINSLIARSVKHEGSRVYIADLDENDREAVKEYAKKDVCKDHENFTIRECIFNFDTEFVEGYEYEGGGYKDN